MFYSVKFAGAPPRPREGLQPLQPRWHLSGPLSVSRLSALAHLRTRLRVDFLYAHAVFLVLFLGRIRP
jgi:hypothetical protein